MISLPKYCIAVVSGVENSLQIERKIKGGGELEWPKNILPPFYPDVTIEHFREVEDLAEKIKNEWFFVPIAIVINVNDFIDDLYAKTQEIKQLIPIAEITLFCSGPVREEIQQIRAQSALYEIKEKDIRLSKVVAATFYMALMKTERETIDRFYCLLYKTPAPNLSLVCGDDGALAPARMVSEMMKGTNLGKSYIEHLNQT